MLTTTEIISALEAFRFAPIESFFVIHTDRNGIERTAWTSIEMSDEPRFEVLAYKSASYVHGIGPYAKCYNVDNFVDIPAIVAAFPGREVKSHDATEEMTDSALTCWMAKDILPGEVIESVNDMGLNETQTAVMLTSAINHPEKMYRATNGKVYMKY